MSMFPSLRTQRVLDDYVRSEDRKNAGLDVVEAKALRDQQATQPDVIELPMTLNLPNAAPVDRLELQFNLIHTPEGFAE